MAKPVPDRGGPHRMVIDLENMKFYSGTEAEIEKQKTKERNAAAKKAEHHRVGMGLVKNYFTDMEKFAVAPVQNEDTMREHTKGSIQPILSHYKSRKAAVKAMGDYADSNPDHLQKLKDLGLGGYFNG
jgi:hypothetical protein